MESSKHKQSKNRGSLVITLLHGRSIQIGDDITITVLDTNGQTGARLRISAPLDLDIKRIFESVMNQ